MADYSAWASREGDLWMIEIPGIGVTQAQSPFEVEQMARDYIAILHDIPIEKVTVSITWPEMKPIVPEDFRHELIGRVMEIFRRDTGAPSIADLDREAPAWREQATEVVDAISAEWTEQLMDMLLICERLRERAGSRCTGFTCDHRAIEHGDLGCELCSCPELMGPSA